MSGSPPSRRSFVSILRGRRHARAVLQPRSEFVPLSTTFPSPNTAAIVTSWWRGLHSYRHGVAQLRRGDIRTVMLQDWTLELARRLGCTDPARLVNVALCAGVLACVHTNVDDSMARILAKANLRQTRFRKLLSLTNEDMDERLSGWRDALLMTRGQGNVPDLTDACLDWTNEKLLRWALDFYPAPRR